MIFGIRTAVATVTTAADDDDDNDDEYYWLVLKTDDKEINKISHFFCRFFRFETKKLFFFLVTSGK